MGLGVGLHRLNRTNTPLFCPHNCPGSCPRPCPPASRLFGHPNLSLSEAVAVAKVVLEGGEFPPGHVPEFDLDGHAPVIWEYSS